MIYLFKELGYNILMDVNSVAVLSLDDIAYDTAKIFEKGLPEDKSRAEEAAGVLFGKHNKPAVLEALIELYSLMEDGLIFAPDEKVEIAPYHLENGVIKAMCLHIAHDCNLSCEYCFADGGEYHQIKEHMPFEVGKAAVDFLICASKGRKNLDVDFFGGEPLINFEVVKQIVEYAKAAGRTHGKNFRFTITTNGVLLNDDKIKYINENMDNVVISLDGREEVNDRMRKSLNGGGSYNKVISSFKRLADSRGQDKYYIRGTFTRYNKDFYKDVLHLADQGFKQISVEPVTAENAALYSIREEDLPEIFESYEILAKDIIRRKSTGGEYNFFHFMVDLDNGPCLIKRIRGCGSGNEYIAVTPSGDIYPCHQFVGNKKYVMGSVFKKELDSEIKKGFSRANVFEKPACGDCFAKFFCSGGCNANNFNHSGSLLEPDKISCELQRKRLRCALAIAVAANNGGD